MSVLLGQADGFEGRGRVCEEFPPNDPPSAKGPCLHQSLIDWSAGHTARCLSRTVAGVMAFALVVVTQVPPTEALAVG